jgi:hypothetical protein
MPWGERSVIASELEVVVAADIEVGVRVTVIDLAD